MLRKLLGQLAGAACLTAVLAAPSTAAPTTTPPPIPHGRALTALAAQEHVLLGTEPGVVATEVIRASGGRLLSGALGIWAVDGAQALTLVPKLERLGVLRYAEPSRTLQVLSHLDGGDPLLEQAWHLERVGADLAEPPPPGVPVTIIDTGIDIAHPDFAGRPAVELLNPQSPATFGDPQYHGTMVASTVGAAANGVGTVGVHPFSALRIFDLRDLEDPSIIAALDAAVQRGDSVVNLSIGGPGYSRSLYEAVMRAVDKGALVVAAAGNHFLVGNPDIYPADYPHVLTVAATDESNDPVFFSSGSPAVDLAAPGADIPVQDPVNPSKFLLVDGTSFSAPIVAAGAAWVWSVRSGLDWTQVFELLRRTARDTGPRGFDPRTGFGVLDIPAALDGPEPPPDPLEPNDDVDLVVASGVLGAAKGALTRRGQGTASLAARLDAYEDPHDVYRVFVPAGAKIRILVRPDANVDAALWSAKARTVLKAKRERIRLSARPGKRTERIVFRNKTRRGTTVFLDVWIPKGRGGDGASYTVDIRTL